MVVVWDFSFVHDCERERERETKIREMRDIILGYIFYCVDILFKCVV